LPQRFDLLTVGVGDNGRDKGVHVDNEAVLNFCEMRHF
jgi:hypothetical protein